MKYNKKESTKITQKQKRFRLFPQNFPNEVSASKSLTKSEDRKLKTINKRTTITLKSFLTFINLQPT